MMGERFTFWDGLQLLLIWAKLHEVILWPWLLVLSPAILYLIGKIGSKIMEEAEK